MVAVDSIDRPYKACHASMLLAALALGTAIFPAYYIRVAS